MHKERDRHKVHKTIQSCETLAQLEMAHALMYCFRDYYKEEIDDLRNAYFARYKKIGSNIRCLK